MIYKNLIVVYMIQEKHEIIRCFKCNKEFSKKDNLKQHFLKNRCKEDISDIYIYNIIDNQEKINNKQEKQLLDKDNIIADNNLRIKELTKFLEVVNNDRDANKEVLVLQKIIQDLKQNTYTSHHDKNLHDTLVDIFQGVSGVYLGFISENVIKFGKTTCIQRRATEHLKAFGNFQLVYFAPNLDYEGLEKIIKRHELIKPHRIILNMNEIRHNEFIQINDKMSLKQVKKILKQESKKLTVCQILHAQKHLNSQVDDQYEEIKSKISEESKIDNSIERFIVPINEDEY